MRLLTGGACPACGRPGPEGLCADCRAAPPAFGRARALAAYSGPVGEALRSFKYRRRLASGAALAAWLVRETPAAWLAGMELVAPVPLHGRRLLGRGFNQAVVLFRPLARARGLEFAPRLLARLRHTRPQVGLKPQERRANVSGAFGVRRPELVQGRRVLLVDDVYTTGATVSECARTLQRAGAAGVAVLTLVRAVGEGPGAPPPATACGRRGVPI